MLPLIMNRIEQYLNNIIEPYMGSDKQSKKIPALALKVVHKGEVLFNSSYGIPEDTIYRIFSMTKPVVSVAALQLWEQGKFLMDEPIEKYIPAFKDMKVLIKDGDKITYEDTKSPITIKHLFTMTSGLSYGFFADEDPVDKIYAEELKDMEVTENFINSLAKLPLAFHPGEYYRYGFSLDVLGRLIEVISGKTLGEYLSTELFGPLEMVDTGFCIPEHKRSRFTPLYNYEGESRTEAEEWMDYYKKEKFESGGGGLVSTMNDYSNFCEMLINRGVFRGKRVIGRKTLDLMRINHLEGKTFKDYFNGEVFTGSPGYGYGLGVRTLIDPAKAGFNGTKGEYGWNGAASTWMMIDPEEEMYLVYMVQMFPYGYHNLIDPIITAVYSCLE